jgi:hypothetical protein
MSIHDFLLENGYRGPIAEPYRDYCVYYHKRNPNVEHHQWLVREYDLSPIKEGLGKSYEVSMCYESKDGTWVDSKFYGITEEELRNKISSFEERLYSSIESMGGHKEHYRGQRID